MIAEDLAGGWLFHFVHRIYCFFAGHRPDTEVSLHNHSLVEPMMVGYESASFVICFRCGAVRCRMVSRL